MFNVCQLRKSQLATQSVKEELAELGRRYQEKVGQWETSQEALDQLTDELQANQNLLRDSRQEVEDLKETLREQVGTLEQQVRTQMHTYRADVVIFPSGQIYHNI